MKVTIYGKEGCAFCKRAKELCQAKGVEHNYIDFVEAGMTKADLQAVVGKPIDTVPQIFVDGAHIGGYTDLVPLVQKATAQPAE